MSPDDARRSSRDTGTSMTRLWARAGRGFEWTAALEISLREAWSIREVGHRNVFFDAPEGSDPLALRTVDDVYLHCGRLTGLDRTRASLTRLAARLGRLDVAQALATWRRLTRVEQIGAHRVTASFLGRRNYTRFEIEEAVGDALASLAPARPDPRARQVQWRVHLWDGCADVGIQLADQPLHRRRWKLDDYPGTLHPPAAAALALIGMPRSGLELLDPFCGAGTIPIEAALLEPRMRIHGSDIDVEAVRRSRENAARAGVEVELRRRDAARLPSDADPVDRLVTNLPWGEAVAVRGELRSAGAFVARIPELLRRHGRAVLLAAPRDEAAERLARAGLAIRHASRVRVSGRVADLLVADLEAPAAADAPFAALVERCHAGYGTAL